MEGHPKMRWEMLRICKERCVHSPWRCHTMRTRSPNISGMLWKIENVLQHVFRLSGNGCSWQDFGRPDLLWSFNTLARSVTKWNRVCGKRLLRLISCIDQTSNDRHFCHVGNSDRRLQAWSLPICFICRWRARFQIHVRRFILRIWIAHVGSQSRGCARSKPQSLTAAPSLTLLRSTLVYECMVYQFFNNGSVYWKHCPIR